MVAVSADNVAQTIAPSPRITGSVLYAPVGTPLPSTSYETLNSSFEDLGYIDENGLKTKEDRATTDVFAWGGDIINTLQDKYSRTMTFKMYQFLDPNVLAAGYRNSNITFTAQTSQNGNETAVALNSQILDTLSWVFDGYFYTNAGFEALIRLVVPIGRIIQLGEISLTNKELASVDATLKAFPDENKNHSYLYVNDGVLTGATTGGS